MQSISTSIASSIQQALSAIIENEPFPSSPDAEQAEQVELPVNQSTNPAILAWYASGVQGHYLKTITGFIDPKFIGMIRSGGHDQRCTVQVDGSLTLFGVHLVFADKAVSLEPGTEVVVYMGRTFCCARVADIEAHIAKVRAAELIEKERKKKRRNAHRDESIAFNANLPIPVNWAPGIKDVLSGLSATSDGTGMMKATVNHVYLKEDLIIGRLKRSQGDFLCSNSKARYGAQYIDPQNSVHDGDGKLYEPKITCKACLAIVERMKKAAAKGK